MNIPILPFSPRQSSAVPIEVHRLDPGDIARDLPLHGHVFFEIIVITGGTGMLMLNGQPHQASKGHAFIIPPCLPHDIGGLGNSSGWALLFLADGAAGRAETSSGLSLRDKTLSGMALEVFGPEQTSRAIILDDETLEALDAFCRRIDTESRSQGRGYDFAVRAALQLILVELARSGEQAGHGAEPFGHARDHLIVSRVFADIDAFYKTDSGLASAARRLGVNAAHLTTKLRRLTGKTYGEWMLERRMLEARHLLVCSDRSLAQIADDLGYRNCESFIRRFRMHHATPPGRWRHNAREHGAFRAAA